MGVGEPLLVTSCCIALRLQEEQSSDPETLHSSELIDVLNLDGHGFAQDVSDLDADPAALRQKP